MLIRDHIDLLRDHALRGPNDDRLGPRFPDMTRAYAPELRALVARGRGRARPSPLEEGVYVAMPGPTLRDAGRGPDAADARRRCDRHVDGARGRRRAPHGRARDRHLVHHEPGRRHHRPGAVARRGHRDRDARARRRSSALLDAHPRGASSHAESSHEPDDERSSIAQRAAQQRAYAPYSKFHVGAAVRDERRAVRRRQRRERVVSGCACAPSATRSPRRVSAGARDLEAVVVCTDASPPSSPCGACRQVLLEFARDPAKVVDHRDQPAAASAARGRSRELLPDGFSRRRAARVSEVDLSRRDDPHDRPAAPRARRRRRDRRRRDRPRRRRYTPQTRRLHDRRLRRLRRDARARAGARPHLPDARARPRRRPRAARLAAQRDLAVRGRARRSRGQRVGASSRAPSCCSAARPRSSTWARCITPTRSSPPPSAPASARRSARR